MSEIKRTLPNRLTEEDVRRAIIGLTANGQQPTLRNIRDYVGYGSLSTIQKFKEMIESKKENLSVESFTETDDIDKYANLELRVTYLEHALETALEENSQPNVELEEKNAEIATLQAEISQLKDDKLEIYKDFSRYIERIEKQLSSARRIIAERNTKIASLQEELTEAKQLLPDQGTEQVLKAQLIAAKQELKTLDNDCLKVSSQLCQQDEMINILKEDLQSMYELWQQTTMVSFDGECNGLILKYNPDKARPIALALKRQGLNEKDICWELAAKYCLGASNGKPYHVSTIRLWLKSHCH
ncbi:MAG: hypothetical protein BWK79_15055 [Beggiatoa sp. IS2]|nr:MAG: hypothetical protein BWK79_15055 [Beggiatoa sp. IS2]